MDRRKQISRKIKFTLVVFQRILIVLAVFLTSVIVIYFTVIIPDQPYPHCNRSCHPFDWPRIYRMNLTLGNHPASRENIQCPNDTICDWSGNSVYAVKRKFSAPSIQVCKDDLVLINVENKVPGHNILLHWHGQHHKSSAFLIYGSSTFQHKLSAAELNSDMYYTFYGIGEDPGISGTLL